MNDIEYENDYPEMDETSAPTAERLRMNEADILSGMLSASAYKQDDDCAVNIEITRQGKKLFEFRVRPISEDEYQRCREKYTKYSKKSGIRVPVKTDTTKFRSAVIDLATVPEDREKTWGNSKLWNSLGVLCPEDAIDAVLMAGEKAAVIEKIEDISGFSEEDESAEETAKN